MNEVTDARPVEAIDPEVEVADPEATGLVNLTKESVEDLLYLADNIDRVIEAKKKIQAAVMKLAQPGDWVLFGEAEKSKAELGFAGALRIGSTLGVNFTNWSAVKETGRDDIGEWYRWEFECDTIFRHRSIRVYGRAGSRDKFFGKADGVYKELSNIDEGNIKIAARRAAMKEGVKVIFGLHHLDPKYVEGCGIKLDRAGGHSFGGKEAAAEGSQTISVQIASITKKVGDGWTKFVVTDIEGVGYSTFSQTVADEAEKAKASKAAVAIVYKKGKYGLDIISLNGVTETKK